MSPREKQILKAVVEAAAGDRTELLPYASMSGVNKPYQLSTPFLIRAVLNALIEGRLE